MSIFGYWFHTKTANGILKVISRLVQAAKANTPGCRSTRNLKCDNVAGKLELALATRDSEEPKIH